MLAVVLFRAMPRRALISGSLGDDDRDKDSTNTDRTRAASTEPIVEERDAET